MKKTGLSCSYPIVRLNRLQAAAICAALLLCLTLINGQSQSIARQELDLAWEDYRLINLSDAKNKFESIADASHASGEQRQEAKLGLIMIKQHRLNNADYDGAIAELEEFRESIDKESRLYAMTLFFTGTAYVMRQYPDLKKAAQYIHQAIEASPGRFMKFLYITEYATVISKPPTYTNLMKATRYIEAVLDTAPQNPLSPIMHQFCGNNHVTVGNYKLARDHFIKMYEKGIEDNSYKATCLFQIANISDFQLGDYETALQYYRIMLDKITHDPLFRLTYVRKRLAVINEQLELK